MEIKIETPVFMPPSDEQGTFFVEGIEFEVRGIDEILGDLLES